MKKTVLPKCAYCKKRIVGKFIIGKEGEDINMIVGKKFCNITCADKYIKKMNKKFFSK